MDDRPQDFETSATSTSSTSGERPERATRRNNGALLTVAVLLLGIVIGWIAAEWRGLLGGQAAGAEGSGAEAAGAVQSHEAASAKTPAKEQYQCPMHPSVVQDQRGDCPICGMKLVPMEGGSAAGEHAAGDSHAGPGAAERRIAYYRSPMNPQETSPVPRKDEMGMDYVPVYEGEAHGVEHGDGEVSGLAAITVDPKRQQLIGLRTVAAQIAPVGTGFRTVGRVAVDETRIRRINVKVRGFVERVFVDFVGKPVRRGEPLFSIYSPDLVSAQQEYLLARRTQASLAKSGLSSSGDDLVAAAKRRLELWDISAADLGELEKNGAPKKTLIIYSPISGVVTAKSVVQGATLNEGDTPYEITDLSTVWVLADIYERDLGRVRPGMPATLVLDAFPNHPFSGRVMFIDPLLDRETRTAKVRLEFKNPSGELRPELFGQVELKTEARDALRIPADAVVPTGEKNVVFVSQGDGRLTPREVELGASDGENVEVTRGLSAGDEVVTRGSFLVDSESRLKAALSSMRGE